MSDRETELLSACTNHIAQKEFLQDALDELKTLYEAKCAEAEALRDKARRAWFAYSGAIEDPDGFQEAMQEMYLTATRAEAGKPLLEEMNKLRQENRQLQMQTVTLNRQLYEALGKSGEDFCEETPQYPGKANEPPQISDSMKKDMGWRE